MSAIAMFRQLTSGSLNSERIEGRGTLAAGDDLLKTDMQ